MTAAENRWTGDNHSSVLLALLILFLIPGVGHAQDVATYESAINGFSFEYPADWEIGVLPVSFSSGQFVERVGLRAPDGTVGLVGVIQLNYRIASADVPVLKPELDAVMQEAAEQIGGTVVRGELFEAEVFGLNYAYAYQIDYPAQEQMIESRQYVFFVADRQYTVTLEAEAEGHERQAGVLDEILASFVVDPR